MKTLVRKLVPLAGATVLAGAILPSAGSTASATSLRAHQEPLLGLLLAPGDRVEISYKVESHVRSPRASLYVRNSRSRRFVSVPMRLEGDPMKGGATLSALVPSRLLHGRKLFYYGVVRDPQSGRTLVLPARGARAPQSSWILERPARIRLGAHRFGHLRRPEAIVARARAADVGWVTEPEFSAGPQTFLVGSDRAMWLEDEVNHRMLVWRAGRPDVALWHSRLPLRFLSWNAQLRTGPDGTLFFLVSSVDFGRPAGRSGGMPMATPAGRPISLAEARRRVTWGHQPMAGALRLVSETYTRHVDGPAHEVRLALVDPRGRLVRAWRVHSRTELLFPAGYTTPELVGGDPVLVLDIQAGVGTPDFRWEREALRLAPGGTRTRCALSKPAVYGENLFADLRIGPDGKLYQLSTSPTTGVVISRYSVS